MHYQVVCDFDLNINQKMLNYVYLPIVGIKAIDLYNTLLNEYDYLKNLYSNVSMEDAHLLKLLNFNLEDLKQNKELLEAIGLIKTYINPHKKDFLIFKICEPLSWRDFSNNHLLIDLFRSKVSNLEFERTKFCFDGNNHLIGLVNVSKTFDQQFTNQITTKQFDFNKLYDELFKITKSLITIDNDVRNNINTYYQDNKILETEIIQCCYQALYKDGLNTKVDNRILMLKIDNLIKQKNINDFNAVKKINRNINLFLGDINELELKNIINDYHSLNSEQYLACIQKNPITSLDVKLIEKLRTGYQLPDFAINILIDYSILINNGRLEPMYLQKIALTINRKNIKNIKDIIQHLKNAAKHHFENKHNNKQVEW